MSLIVDRPYPAKHPLFTTSLTAADVWALQEVVARIVGSSASKILIGQAGSRVIVTNFNLVSNGLPPNLGAAYLSPQFLSAAAQNQYSNVLKQHLAQNLIQFDKTKDGLIYIPTAELPSAGNTFYFVTESGGTSAFNLTRTMVHELAHAAVLQSSPSAATQFQNTPWTNPLEVIAINA
ncbi:MAG: hypothetical protein ACXW27_10875 [Allosphingosinicella sp.]